MYHLMYVMYVTYVMYDHLCTTLHGKAAVRMELQRQLPAGPSGCLALLWPLRNARRSWEYRGCLGWVGVAQGPWHMRIAVRTVIPE